jgi:Ca2+-binding EF-hand superfamily protein
LLKIDPSTVAQQCNEATLKEIFEIWDENNSGTVDSTELANCLAILCGGSL